MKKILPKFWDLSSLSFCIVWVTVIEHSGSVQTSHSTSPKLDSTQNSSKSLKVSEKKKKKTCRQWQIWTHHHPGLLSTYCFGSSSGPLFLLRTTVNLNLQCIPNNHRQSTTVLTTKEGMRIAKWEICGEKVCFPIFNCGKQPNIDFKIFSAKSAHLQHQSSSLYKSGKHPST